MKIINCQKKDLPEIFKLYELATNYQKIKFPENLWPKFSEDLVRLAIKEKQQFKIVINTKIACIWTITYNDIEIWGEDDNNSIYIHRIATNPIFRGNNFVSEIVKWAEKKATVDGKKFIRMDTCGKNERLINHYKNSGFNFLGIEKIKSSAGLPSHYKDAQVCYFEIELKLKSLML